MIDLRKHIIFPGQFLITSVPSLISTVLGSCVSVCLWDRETKVAGMNHYLLPGTSDDDAGNSNRGLTSIRMLIRSMINRRTDLCNVDAKIFGGCNSLYRNKDIFKIGERNVSIALEVLKEYNIHVSAQHVGGHYGRKIVFNTSTGKVKMRLLTKNQDINEEIDRGFGY